MALTFDMSCLFSTVKNGAGVARKFGFLPPHGRELDADEEFTFFGHVTEAMVGVDRPTSKRNIDALQRAVDAGDVLLIKTPNPILQDVSTEETKMLELNGGSLAAVDPCWTESLSA